MNRNLIAGICGTIEVVCICGLAAIGLKRNKDAYDAEIKCINAQCEMLKTKIDNAFKDVEIKVLKEELAKLKGESEKEEEA